jgi:hypothetical protein
MCVSLKFFVQKKIFAERPFAEMLRTGQALVYRRCSDCDQTLASSYQSQ